MKDRNLLSVTELSITEVPDGDLCGVSWHTACDNFLNKHGRKGLIEILSKLNLLKKNVKRELRKLKKKIYVVK